MIRPNLSLAVSLALANLAVPLSTQAPARTNDAFAGYLAQHYANLGKTSCAQFLADAAQAGLIQTPADRSSAKRAFANATQRQHAKGSKGRRGNAFNTQRTPLRGPPNQQTGPRSAINETEWNDSIGWADDMTGQTTANGTMSSNTDKDFFRFVVPSDSVVTVTVAGGSPVVDDPDLELFDAAGFTVDYDDDSVGLYPSISVVLPAGVYYAAVGCPFANVFGGYVLTTSITPTTIPTLVSSVVTNGTLNGLTNPTYRLLLGADSRVTSTVNGGVFDLYMQFRTASGQLLLSADDSSGGLDPGFNSNLPAGIYYVTFGEWTNLVGPFTFKFTTTAAAMPVLSCSTPATGNIAGDEDWDLRKIVLATNQRVTFASGPSGAGPMTDTLVHLLDAKLHEFAFNDENNTISSFALLDTPLPAGTYYVAHEGYFGDAGGYSLTATCGQPVTVTPIAWGLTATSLVTPAVSEAYSFKVGTDNPVEVHTATTLSSSLDTQIAILDANGICHGRDDDSFGTLDSATGDALTEGVHWVLVRDWFNSTGAFDLHVHPPLAFEDAVNNRTLVTLDKAGNLDVAFVAINLLPFGLPLPAPIQGKLLIDLSLYIQLGPIGTPGTGSFQWSPSLQPYPGLVVQAISFTPSFSSLKMTDVVK